MVRQCKAQTVSGSPCSATPVRADGYCWWHSPALAEERDAARRRGGAARSNKARAAKQIPPAMSAADLAGWLSLLFTQVLTGRIEPKIGTACATIARTLLEVRTTTELEQRLSELEARAGVAEAPRWRA
jgi:hypothetical protein